MLNSITEYVSYFEAGEDMTDEEYGIYMRAIHNFAYRDIEPDYTKLSPLVKAALRTVIASVRKNKEDRVNGSLGGSAKARKTKESEPPVEIKNVPPYKNENYPPTEEKSSNVNVNVNENVNANENVLDAPAGATHTKRFKKPTVSEISAYCSERKNTVNAQRFFDYYESKGWKVGNSPMKDWKAAVRTWEQKNETPHFTSSPPIKALPDDRLML